MYPTIRRMPAAVLALRKYGGRVLIPRALIAVKLVLGTVIPLMSPTSAQGETGAEQLAPVVVSASRNETRVEDMPLHTTVITQEDIRRSPAQRLDQLLRTIPRFSFTGVPANQSDPTGHQTRMRGLGNAKVLVLVDGVPIHDPVYLTTQWFKVPLFTVERVEVIRGVTRASGETWPSQAS